MRNLNIRTRTARAIFAVGSSALALSLAAGTAKAQDDADGSEDIITVTGSRIATDGMQAPVPVTVVAAEEIENLSPGALITGVSQLPQFAGNQTPNSGAIGSGAIFTRSGAGALNLRGLGANRTLTLLNGRRMASATAFGGVDINMFPEAMIRAVETTTGGASAAYGSDAVAGVVNFILDTGFSGLEVSVQGGITDRNDGENYELSAAYGTEFGGGRGHFLLSGEYAKQEGVHDYSGRDWYNAWGTLGAGTAANPYRFSPNVVSANGTFDGLIFAPGTAINGLAFNRTGGVAPFVPGSVVQGTIGTPGARTVSTTLDDISAEVNTLYPDVERYSAFAYAEYELTDNLKVFGQFIHGQTETFQYNSPRGLFTGAPTALTIFSGNPYLPASVQTLMTQNNIASFSLRRLGTLLDVGNLYYDDRTRQNIGTAGFEFDVTSGGFMDGWSIDGFYQYGHSRRDMWQNALRVDRIFAAVDAVRDPNNPNNIICRVSTTAAGRAAFPGCQPVNLFGRGGGLTPTPAGYDYVVGLEPGQSITTPIYFADGGYGPGKTYSYETSEEKRNVTTFQQHFAELTASGDLFDLWAGTVAGAIGGSYRRDSILQLVQDPSNLTSNHELPFSARLDPAGNVLPRPVLCNDAALGLRGVSVPDCNNTVGNQFSKVSNIQGVSTVWEGFGEVLVPLIDTDSISLVSNAAVRWADYSGSGSVWAYKGGLELGLADEQIRLRGTYSRDVRAGNLSERFDKTGGAATVDDPRTPNVVEVINTTRFSGGNPAIQPESADTWTAGIVLRPDFLPGLSMSLDYYNIKLTDAISQVGNQSVLDRCFIQKAQEFCDRITLTTGPATPTAVGDIVLVGDIFVNVAQAAAEGVDFEGSYNTDLTLFGGDETLGARVLASWLIERSETNANGLTSDFAGQVGATQGTGLYLPYADFRGTVSLTYRNDGFSTLLQARHIGSGLQDACGQPGRCPTLTSIVDNDVKSVTYLDFRLGYEFDMAGTEMEVFGNVTNLTDAAPPVTPAYLAGPGTGNQHNPAVYDVLGRRFTVGVNVKM